MIDYTTLEAVKAAHRIDQDDDDSHLSLLITAATRQVSGYIGAEAPDPEFLSEVREDIQLATIMLVGFLYANSDADPAKAFDPGYLPAPVQSLLYPLRTPTAV